MGLMINKIKIWVYLQLLHKFPFFSLSQLLNRKLEFFPTTRRLLKSKLRIYAHYKWLFKTQLDDTKRNTMAYLKKLVKFFEQISPDKNAKVFDWLNSFSSTQMIYCYLKKAEFLTNTPIIFGIGSIYEKKNLLSHKILCEISWNCQKYWKSKFENIFILHQLATVRYFHFYIRWF